MKGPSGSKLREMAEIEGWVLGVSEGTATAASKRATVTGKACGTGLESPPSVPRISSFYGIVITMYYVEHGRPHFHAAYGGLEASIDIETHELRGTLPPRALRLVLEWAGLHRAELLENWDRARGSQSLKRIAPLE